MSPRHLSLADAGDLVIWADRLDSQSGLPKLVRRLILASAKTLKQVSFRAGEGIQVLGWDGITVADAPHPFVPAGVAGWELSARKDVKAKANEDYAGRLKNPDGLNPAEAAFIFVTLRRWPGKNDWAKAREAEGQWRAVHVYDADDLESWLEAAPSVHLWLSLALGKHSEDGIDLETFWADWSGLTRPALTSKFLLAGRQAAVEAIHERLRNGTESFAVKAESADEALAVFTAAVHALPEQEREECVARTLVVRTRAALEHLAASDTSLILIPLFDDAAAISRPVRRGHRVVTLVGSSHPDTTTTITVPRLSVEDAGKVLVEGGFPDEKARDLAAMGRRSLMALRRKMAIRPEMQQPLWARPENAPALLTFLLAGSWDEASLGDGEILGALAQAEVPRVLETAARWSREADPAVRSIGNIWYLASKEDAWALLSGALTRASLERFEAAVFTALGAADSSVDVSAEGGWFNFKRPRYSAVLRRGLAETLGIMGSRGAAVSVAGVPADQWARRIVRTLLDQANADWRIWASISALLPRLAEAAPEEFLGAVEKGLTGDQPVMKLFQEHGEPALPSSPYTGLLWALEKVAWSADHLPRASLVLAKLARLDPGGKLANRPRNSLRETFVLWHPQTAAPWERQLEVLRMVLDREPDSGWRLLADLLPQFHDSSVSRAKPEWRDWASEGSLSVTHADHGRRVRDLVAHMLTAVGRNGQRWTDLIGALPNLPPDTHNAVTERLESLRSEDLVPEDRARVWDALREVLAQHRSFPEAKWALPKDRIDRLDAIYRRLEPADVPSRFAWLFGESVRLPEGHENDWRAEQQAIAEARRDAVATTHDQLGTAGVEDLMDHVANPFDLGEVFGASGLAPEDEDRLLRQHLASEKRARRAFAAGYVAGRGSKHGRTWVEEKFELAGLSVLQRADILVRLPSEAATWALARSEPAIDEAYWQQSYPHLSGSAEDVEYAARRMVQHGRAFTAAELIAFRLTDTPPPSPDLIADVLEAVLKQKDVDGRTSSFVYWAGKLLDALASAPGIDDDRVAKLEWGFSVILRHDRPPAVLHRELARNPEFFVELLTLIYRREGEELRETEDVSETDLNRTTVAFHVLESWASLPATSQEGVVDESGLEAWVTKALTAAAEAGRPTMGAQRVGRVLSHSPHGADGAWPHEAVRDVIETLANEDIEAGFEIGKFNSRGIVTRSLSEGGKQEQAIADEYAGWAKQIAARWPRTAAMLRRMEARYREEARQEDVETDLRNEGFW